MRALLLMPAELLESEEKELQKVLRESLLALVPYEVRLRGMLRALPHLLVVQAGNEATKLSCFMSHFWFLPLSPPLPLALTRQRAGRSSRGFSSS